MKPFAIIAAMDEQRGVGKGGTLPWHLPADLKHFSQLTTGGTVIMGRKTWESLPEKYRPLPRRVNVVLSRSEEIQSTLPEGVLWAPTLEAALALAEQQNPEGMAFLIGGGELFQQGIHHPQCHRLFLTEVMGDFECDTFFPEIEDAVYARGPSTETLEEKGIDFQFVEYDRRV